MRRPPRRAQYFAAAGELLDEDSELFDSRMAAFLEWYVIERPLAGPECRTHARAVVPGRGQGSADPGRAETPCSACRPAGAACSPSRTVKAGKVVLADLLGGQDVVALERRGTAGFSVDDLCEARVCESEGAFIFTKTLLFHPRDAAKEIRGRRSRRR